MVIKLLICFQENRMFQAKSHLPAGLLDMDRERERHAALAREHAERQIVRWERKHNDSQRREIEIEEVM